MFLQVKWTKNLRIYKISPNFIKYELFSQKKTRRSLFLGGNNEGGKFRSWTFLLRQAPAQVV